MKVGLLSHPISNKFHQIKLSDSGKLKLLFNKL